MNNCLRHPTREHFVLKAALALDLFLWLWWLPIILQISTIPVLLKRLSGAAKYKGKPVVELQAAAGIVMRICHLRPFRSRIFPKQCLRQSLTLYRTLTRMGYPVEIHFGVLKDEKNFRGHSWVTIEREPVADTTQSGIFNVVYSYSSAHTFSGPSDHSEIEGSKDKSMFSEA